MGNVLSGIAASLLPPIITMALLIKKNFVAGNHL
jgi:hypothetical protein